MMSTFSKPSSKFATSNFTYKPFIRNPKQKTVIILTQVRSGSSFMGDLLNHLPKSYFTAEPIRAFLNISFPNNGTDHKVLQTFMDGVLKCNFHQSLLESRLNFPDNLDIEYGLDDVKFRTFMCMRSNIHVIKLVTIRIKHLLEFMEDPELDIYIIHLLRDPRGILNSVKYIQTENFLQTPNYYCENMRKDLKSSKLLRSIYPNRWDCYTKL